MRWPGYLALVWLAGCGENRAGDRTIPVRIDLGNVSANARRIEDAASPATLAPASWAYVPAARVATFGPTGRPALLTVSCERGPRLAAILVVKRYAGAERGAQALFAIQGSKGILRLPVSAVNFGERGYVWRGVLDPADPRAEVLLGSGLKATVPGGGQLDLPPMGAAGTVVHECVTRQAQQARTTVVQTLPNLASNSVTSPADR